MSIKRTLECTGAVFVLAFAAQAGERVVLTTGYEIHADHHEMAGDAVRIFSGNGVTELPQVLIAEYRAEEYTPPPTPELSKAAVPVSTSKLAGVRDLIESTANKYGLSKELVTLVASVIRQESGFQPNAISRKGAIGLMQLMPGTARDLGADPRDPAQNIDAGTRYLTALLTRYKDQDDQVLRALAAYNAGPGAVDKYKGVPPYRETRDYVRRVVRNYLAANQTAQTRAN